MYIGRPIIPLAPKPRQTPMRTTSEPKQQNEKLTIVAVGQINKLFYLLIIESIGVRFINLFNTDLFALISLTCCSRKLSLLD